MSAVDSQEQDGGVTSGLRPGSGCVAAHREPMLQNMTAAQPADMQKVIYRGLESVRTGFYSPPVLFAFS